MCSLPENLLDLIPDSLHEQVKLYWQDWVVACEKAGIDPRSGHDMVELGRLWACSDFIARQCARFPDYAVSLADSLDKPLSRDDYAELLQSLLNGVCEIAECRILLRQFRNQQMLRIAIRDIGEHASIDELLKEQSDLSSAIIDRLAQFLHELYSADLGIPRNTEGVEQRLVILAMGKLGGDELNYSSDIDLIFFYPEDGQLDGRRPLSNQEYFIRLCREFVQALDDVTADGFVYRVDTRLRPYGDSGPVVMSFAAMENYYESQGRDWERYAMIKARVVHGRDDDAAYLVSALTPFVFRRYLDFSVFEGIREMKSMIEQQVKRKSLQGNIKLGKGGIREIEFIGQTFQLIRGGRDKRLQARSIIRVLRTLAELAVLSQDDVGSLLTAYRYLRSLENRLQIERDKQTHELPEDEILQQRIALAMRQHSWQQVESEVERQTDIVHEIFTRLIDEQETDRSAKSGAGLKAAMQHLFDEAETEMLQQTLVEQGIHITETEFDVLSHFARSTAVSKLPDRTRELCVSLLAVLLTEIEDEHASETMQRLIDIISAVIGRSVYLSMMLQYPILRQRVIWLCQASQWFSDQIRQMPILLDELLEGHDHLELPTTEQLAVQLDAKISSVPDGDFELILDSLRVFKQANQFNIAMLDIVAEHEVTELADRISDIAVLLVNKALQLAWDEIAARHGEPVCVVESETLRPGLAVIAYGKLGGAELGYGSDLDLVFIHNSRGEKQNTDGDRQLDNRSFFSKVVQRFIHILGTRTFSGVLYEIDTRLRPDGQSGLMVTSIEAFEQYQLERAWTWEHQALVRARFVAGDDQVAEEFDRIRSSVLAKQRDWQVLAKDVVEMRQKMRIHLSSKTGSGVDLKQDAGGLVDIEFIAQAGVLQLASQHPALLQSTATLVLLAELSGAGWLSRQEFEQLYRAYNSLRRATNYQKLAVVNECLLRECESSMQQVMPIWQRLFAEFEYQHADAD